MAIAFNETVLIVDILSKIASVIASLTCRVLSANGYFDLATPFFATEYDLSYMGLDPSLRKNLRITYYQTGHMIYLDDSALHALKADLARFLR